MDFTGNFNEARTEVYVVASLFLAISFPQDSLYNTMWKDISTEAKFKCENHTWQYDAIQGIRYIQWHLCLLISALPIVFQSV